MSDQEAVLSQCNEWLKDGSGVAALVMRQLLEPVEGKDAIIFPPTYAKPERVREEDWPGYNIDYFGEGPDRTNICLLDSVGSQANRMEPVFKRERYKDLVPQVVIKAEEKEVNLLDAGHRAGDAIARFAGKMEGGDTANEKTLGEHLWTAFQAWQQHGDGEPLAKIAPTSLVFGAWDSRATQAKVPRIVRSVIRAYNVRVCKRSATFTTPLNFVNDGLIDEALNKGEGEKNPLSQEGFLYSLASSSHGGVEVMGEIRRDAALNLVALRTLGVCPTKWETAEKTEERKMKLRRYIFGLALVSLTHRDDQQFNLREGCLLRISSHFSWKVVPFEGDRQEISIDPNAALSFAQSAARDFGVQAVPRPFVFDKDQANKWLKLAKDDRDKRRRRGPVIAQDLK
jgi:CRISPR-associated protein Csb1